MRLPSILAIIGLLLATLGGLCYWQTMQIAIPLAYSSGGPNLNRTAWYAIGLVGLGLAMFLICFVINFLVKDSED